MLLFGYARHWAMVRQPSNKFGSFSHLAPMVFLLGSTQSLLKNSMCFLEVIIAVLLSLCTTFSGTKLVRAATGVTCRIADGEKRKKRQQLERQ